LCAQAVRQRRRRGSQLVEMALILLPFMAIFCGFFDVCLAIMKWTTLQNAVREGCRYAVTFRTMSGMGQDMSIKTVVQGYSFGMVSAAASPAQITVNYYTTSAPNTLIAAPNGNTPGNIVEVSVPNAPWAWIAPISGSLLNPRYATSPLSITVTSADILGGYPAGVVSVSR